MQGFEKSAEQFPTETGGQSDVMTLREATAEERRQRYGRLYSLHMQTADPRLKLVPTQQTDMQSLSPRHLPVLLHSSLSCSLLPLVS